MKWGLTHLVHMSGLIIKLQRGALNGWKVQCKHMLLLIIILSVRFNTQFRVKMSTHTFTSLFPSLLTKKYLSFKWNDFTV